MKIKLHLFAVLLAAIGVSSFHSLAQLKPLSLVSPLAQLPALSPLPNTVSLVPPKDPNKFTFFVAGDNRPKNESVAPTATVVSFFNNVAKFSPSLVMLAGDTIYGKNPGDEQLIQQEYAAFCQAAKKGGVPVFNAPGNHELDDQNDVPNTQMQNWYVQYMGAPYGAFNYGNSRFIAMNTEEIAPQATTRAARAPTDTPGKTLDPGYVSQAQFDALKADLDANKAKRHIFIFMHHPIKPAKQEDGLDPICAKPLEDLFSHYKNISYVIAAHEHLYYNPQGNGTSPPPAWTAKQPPVYLVSGGAGAPLTRHAAPGLAVYHYLIFTVNGNDVTVTFQKL
jgi:2',3'-cyclic-nucleotide 2'-phosphodiesterase (5'-nucleotidase family)